MTIYDIVETPCYPAKWKVAQRGHYGAFNNTCYYFPSEELAMEEIFQYQKIHGADKIGFGDIITRDDKRNPFYT